MDISFLFSLIILLFSITFHEVSHGYIANFLGDPTAKYAGRLSLNPLKHLDLVGSFLFPLFLIILKFPFIFGWAKPVPVNPYNFRDQKYGSAKVSLAGPAANFLIALVFGLIIRFLSSYLKVPALFSMFSFIVIINLLLAIFNLIPIPPLDGSHILFTFLPQKMEHWKFILIQYGFLILILFISFGGFRLLLPIISGLYFLITGQPLGSY